MSDWIDAKDSLPGIGYPEETSKNVLVCVEYEEDDLDLEICVGYLSLGEGWYTYTHHNCELVGEKNDDRVIAWMPLPDAPVKKKPKEKAPKETPTKRSPTPDVGKIRALHDAGWTISKIADEMGISSSCVGYYVKKINQEALKNEPKGNT